MVIVKRSEPSIAAVVGAAFPEYKGKEVRLHTSEKIQVYNNYWDDGNRRYYQVVRLADLEAHAIETASWERIGAGDDGGGELKIPEGFVVVVHDYHRQAQTMEIHAPAASLVPLIPAPVELTWQEKTVLAATRSLVSSYGGVKNFRLQEARSTTGITTAEWDSAKASCIARKLLNAAGAITTAGRNAIGSVSLSSCRPK